MKALMLAAGIGRRLSGGDDSHPPKLLLEFGGESLLARHLKQLASVGVLDLTLVVGYHAQDIKDATNALGAGDRIKFLFNKDYREGSIVSLWRARELLQSSGPVLLMDADVLYHTELLRRLLNAPAENCFTFDAEVDNDEEPVKLCLRDGAPVEFGKVISGQFDRVGEWPGFLKLSPEWSTRLATRLDQFMVTGRTGAAYEDAVREVLLEVPPGTFAIADITGIPWIEIDFEEDVERASSVILPAINAFIPADGS